MKGKGMQFPQTVQAARAVSTDHKTLAAAIYAEIPPRKSGRTPAGTATIEDLLVEMAAELAKEGYDYSDGTLKEYRKVAAWAANGGDLPPDWLPVSWSAHYEAQRGGMAFARFAELVEVGGITGVDSLRRVLGKGTTRATSPGEKVAKTVEAIKAGEVSTAELHELTKAAGEALTRSTGAETNPGRLTDRGKSRDQLDDEAYWAKVRAALDVLVEALQRIEQGATAPADVELRLQIVRPDGDWDRAAHEQVYN